MIEGTVGLARVAPMARERGGRLADLRGRLLQELRDLRMPLTTAGPREQVVGDVPDQHVLEDELLVALDRGDHLPADQVASLERVQELRQAPRIVTHPLQSAAPENLAT